LHHHKCFREIARISTRGSSHYGQSCDLFHSRSGFDSLCAPCHSRGALPAHWAYRMFNEPWGIVVMRVSWLRHPMLIKKKREIARTNINYNLILVSWIFSHSQAYDKTLSITLTSIQGVFIIVFQIVFYKNLIYFCLK
jgi:hypothetical protein